MKTIDPNCFVDCDAVIHCAYDSSPGALKINLSGTKRLFTEVQQAGVKFQVLIGSLSAHPNTSSEYGQLKHQLEKFFIEQGQTVVKPGLVIGNGGLYARNKQAIERTPLLLLPDADLILV